MLVLFPQFLIVIEDQKIPIAGQPMELSKSKILEKRLTIIQQTNSKEISL